MECEPAAPTQEQMSWSDELNILGLPYVSNAGLRSAHAFAVQALRFPGTAPGSGRRRRSPFHFLGIQTSWRDHTLAPGLSLWTLAWFVLFLKSSERGGTGLEPVRPHFG